MEKIAALKKGWVTKLVWLGLIAAVIFFGYQFVKLHKTNVLYCVTHEVECRIWRLESQRDTLLQLDGDKINRLQDILDK